jgi:hypothetical protein
MDDLQNASFSTGNASFPLGNTLISTGTTQFID